MKQNLVLKNVLKKLKASHVEIIKESVIEDKRHIIFADMVVVLLDENSNLILSFDVDVRPDFAAFLSIELSKIRGIKNILIGELFMHDIKNKNVLTGQEAVSEFLKLSRQTAVSEFMKEQMGEYMLRSDVKIPSC